MIGICLEIKTVCKSCGNPLPVNAFVEEINCPACQNKAELPYSFWKKSILDSALTEYGELKEGEGQTQTVMTGEYTFNNMYGLQKPRCAKCKTTLDETKYEEYAKSGSTKCTKCGNTVSFRLLPESVKKVFPQVKYAAGEDSDLFSTGKQSMPAPAASKPILFTCPSCAGNLKIDGTSRTVTCTYCDSEIYLPDDLWLRMHPVKTVNRWYLVLDGNISADGVAADTPGNLPDWYYIPGFCIDKDGNSYVASSDDDEEDITVWSFDRDLKTRWVRKGVKSDNEETGLALANDGNLFLWSKRKHSLLKLSSKDGSTIKKLESRDATDDQPYSFDLEGCTTLVSCPDNTILALINNNVARFNEDGERVELWSGKTLGLIGSGIGHIIPKDADEWAPCLKEVHGHPKRIDSDLTKMNIGWDGYLYMLDRSSSDGEVVRFDHDGSKLMSVLVPLENKDCTPWADKDGNIYIIGTVKDYKAHLIRISANGKRIETLLTDLKEGGVLNDEDQLGLRPDGTIYAYKYYNRLKVFTPDMKMIFRSKQSEKDDNEAIEKMQKEQAKKKEFN